MLDGWSLVKIFHGGYRNWLELWKLLLAEDTAAWSSRKCWSKMIESLKNRQKNASSNTVSGWISELLLVLSMFILSFTVQCLMNSYDFRPPPAKINFQGFLFHRLRFCWEVSFQRVRNLVPSSCNQPESWPCKLSKWCAIFQWGLLWLGFSNEDQNDLKKRCDRKVLCF